LSLSLFAIATHHSKQYSIMSESPVAQEKDEQVPESSDTAFSRFGGTVARRSYGPAASGMDTTDTTAKDSPRGNILTSADLLTVDMSQPDYSQSLFAMTNDDDDDESPSNDACTLKSDEEGEEESDKENTSDDKGVEYLDDDTDKEEEQPEKEPVSRGRTKTSFRSVLESTGESASLTPTTEPVKNTKEAVDETQDDISDSEAEEDVDDDATVEFHTNDETPPVAEKQVKETVVEETATTSKETATTKASEEKNQPDKDALITSIDNLFVHADKLTVTVRDIVLSLEAEYDVKFLKPTKNIVRTHLTDLIKGHVEPTVESEEPASESEDEEKEVSDAGEDFESSDDEEEQVKKAPKKKRKAKSTKRVSPRQKPSKKKPSHVRIHAEMLRKRRIEELRVRNEELQVKQSKEDQKRAEQIAAKFETDTDELRLKRLEDRLDLLQKLDQKRIRVISDEAKGEGKAPKVNLEETAKLMANDDNQVPSAAKTEDSDDSDDDFELEIVGKDEPSATTKPFPKVATAGPPVVAKSSAISMLDMVGGLKPSDKKSKRVISLTADRPQASPGKSMTARAALRNSLRAKQRKGANMWLARELGYKTQEEHMRDCMLVEQKKREDVVKREEERLKANERKQLRERLLMDSSPYEEAEEEKYNPDDEVEGTTGGADDGNESDEEMAQARQIEEEQNSESTPEEKSPDASTSSEDDVDATPDEDYEPQAKKNVAESKEEHQSEDTQPLEAATVPAENESPVLDANSADAETQEVEMDGGATESAVVADQKEADQPNQDDVTKLGDETIAPSDDSEPPVEDSNATKPVSDPDTPTLAADQNDEDHASTNDAVEDVEENEFAGDSPDAEFGDEDVAEENKGPKDKNAGWKAMLQKEAEKLKKQKARKNGKGLVEAEADEEEEEEVAGLEDFGFSVANKKKDDDDAEEADADKLTEEDLKHVVDDLSDDEGDEEAGEAARKELEQKEEKERHKEIIRRMRDGYDGRRGGIAGAGVGARGMHRFDQLVAADNREDAKRLGLLNDDELDSDNEAAKGDGNGDDEEDDENALLDKMLKDRFLHRSSLDEVEENFSSDEEEEEEVTEGTCVYALRVSLLLRCNLTNTSPCLQTRIKTPKTMMRRNKSAWQSDLRSVLECSGLLRLTARMRSFRSFVSLTRTKPRGSNSK